MIKREFNVDKKYKINKSRRQKMSNTNISLENKIKKEYYKIIYNKITERIKIRSINEIIPLNRKRLLWDMQLTLMITRIV